MNARQRAERERKRIGTKNLFLFLKPRLKAIAVRLASSRLPAIVLLLIITAAAITGLTIIVRHYGPELLDKPGASGLIQSVVTLIAGLFALVTFVINHRQKSYHFDRQELEFQFKDIQDRFADKESPLMRANAAFRLGEYARRVLPGRPSLKEHRSFAFFRLVSSELASSLYMEDDRDVRRAVRSALESLIEFCKPDGYELLDTLINSIADSNRILYERWIVAAIQVDTQHTDAHEKERIELVSRLSPIHRIDHANAKLIRGILSSQEAKRIAIAQIHVGGRPEVGRELVRDLAVRLCVSRDLLAEALSARRTPKSARIDRLYPFPSYSLEGCFLAGAVIQHLEYVNCYAASLNFSGAMIIESDFRNSWLVNADFSYTSLRNSRFDSTTLNDCNYRSCSAHGASFVGAQLSDCILCKADFSSTCFDNSTAHFFGTRCDFSNASFRSAILSSCRFRSAKLHATDFRLANLEWADLADATAFHADFRGAGLECARLTGTKFIGSEFGPSEAEGAMLQDANWWDAVFSDPAGLPSSLPEWATKKWPKSQRVIDNHAGVWTDKDTEPDPCEPIAQKPTSAPAH